MSSRTIGELMKEADVSKYELAVYKSMAEIWVFFPTVFEKKSAHKF